MEEEDCAEGRPLVGLRVLCVFRNRYGVEHLLKIHGGRRQLGQQAYYFGGTRWPIVGIARVNIHLSRLGSCYKALHV